MPLEKRRFIVIREGCSDEACCRLVALRGGRVVKRLPIVGAIVVEGYPEGALDELRALPDVAQIEDDLTIRALGGSSASWSQWVDPRRDRPWAWTPVGVSAALPQRERAPQIPWGVRHVGAPLVWPQAKGKGARVAVVDTGIDSEHPELEGRVAGGYGATGEGWSDENGHGTHVAGTVAAAGRFGGVVGVAPEAKLLAVRVLGRYGQGRLSDLIDGLGWCLEHRVDVVNLSLGTAEGHPLMERAIARLIDASILVVAAAGNSGPGPDTLEYPGACAGVISVGAISPDGRVARFSSRGPSLSLAAPGVGILSTWPGGEYRSLDGTSMAAPHVAGVAALLISREGKTARSASVEGALLGGALPLEGWGLEDQGRGVVCAPRSFRLGEPV